MTRCRTTRWPRAADPNARRIIAHGLRNPFRFTQRPGTDELWVGDVGWNDWEEINVLTPAGPAVENFGWPCYEGSGRQSGYDSANLNICENLYASAGAVTAPYHAYHHSSRVVPNETCPTGSSSVAGLQFEFAAAQSSYPAEYDDALFFADYSRDCIWVMPKGADGKPAPGLVRTFVAGAANPVNLQIGPGGDLFYVDFDGGTIRRITYTSANQAPVAVATATPTTGSAPLTVTFDGSGSSDPDPGDVADLRVGPRRRRGLRRRDRRAADVHLHHPGHLHRRAQGDRQPGCDGDRLRRHLGGQHGTDGGHPDACRGHHLEGG